jgi:hypothetical protein
MTPARARPEMSVATVSGSIRAWMPVNTTDARAMGVPSESRASNTSARDSWAPATPR